MEFFEGDGIGIEIIVKMDGVHIVTRHDVGDDLHRMGDRFGLAGIEIQLLSVAFEDFRFPEIQVLGAELFLIGGSHAIGIEPGVQFHPAGMALFDHELQRIPERIGRDALLTGEEAGPRFDR